MKHAALLLGIVALFIFAACGNGDKGEQPAESEYQGTVEEMQQGPEAVTQTPQDVEEEGEQAEETLKEKTGEAVETVREKTGEAVEAVKEKAAQPFEGMAEKMGGHADAAKQAMEE